MSSEATGDATDPAPAAKAAAASAAATSAAQLVEHVDEAGRVIEIVTRAEMRARSLRHRSVYIVVRSPDDEVLLHKRADWKDVFPGAWDLAFGGVCDPGESWFESAQRELREEAGIEAELHDCGQVVFEAEDCALIGRLYYCESSGPFNFNDGEVTDSQWLPRTDLAAFAATHAVPDDTAEAVLPIISNWSR